jgi:hypothetical protein
MQLESDRVNSTSDRTAIERLKLPGVDRLMYFAPALFFG